jgi:coenzyme F420 biosynthesis associated uncharacterized protein
MHAASVQPLAYEFAQRVSAYSGLAMPAQLPPLEAVDRAAWIAANLRTMRPLMSPLSERLGAGAGLLSGPVRSASGFLLGVQIGALTGALSQRVLGQYDLALLDASVPPRLLLLAPNLTITARSLSVDRDELVKWVAIHEITHAVQFSAVPWLREHLGGMLKELLASVQVVLGPRGAAQAAQGANARKHPPAGGGARRWSWAPDLGDILQILERARRGELLRLTLGEERWRLVERTQAVMSLIEGHAEHTMDAVGVEVLPTLPRLRAAMTRRRSARPLPWRIIERLLGLEMKMRQYEVGRSFCDAVVERDGPRALARVWSAPQALPSSAELAHPADWLLRTRPQAQSG